MLMKKYQLFSSLYCSSFVFSPHKSVLSFDGVFETPAGARVQPAKLGERL